MRLTEGYVFLKDAVFYAFHGVMPQEQQVGGCYKVSLRVGYPLAQAMASDAVEDTLNYATLYALVERRCRQRDLSQGDFHRSDADEAESADGCRL